MAPRTDIATRALVVTLKSPVGGQTSVKISEKTGLSVNTINRIYTQAITRRFDPNHQPFILKDEWLQNTPRSGRLTKQTPETTKKVILKVYKNRYSREKSATDLANKLSLASINISAFTVRSTAPLSMWAFCDCDE